MELTREKILAMNEQELSIEVAERIFKAKIISKEKNPESKLLIGYFENESWKPLKGRWTNANWENSEEKAWLNCPMYAEDIAAAWEVAGMFPLMMIERVEVFFGNVTVNATIYPSADSEQSYTATASNAPLAICRAALLSTLTEQEQ